MANNLCWGAFTMAQRPKLTIEQQVQHMKSRGVTFSIYSESAAENFLRNSTYFFKIKAFDKDFIFNPVTHSYVNLDFAYLIELSTLDMHLRRLILHATLDIEHYLKVWLLRDISSNPNEDGYDIVRRFFMAYPEVKVAVEAKAENSMCKDLIEKLQLEGYAVWNLIEVLSFGDFIKLFTVYDQNNGDRNKDLISCLFAVRCLRNAAAHNNCLLNSLRAPYTRTIRASMYLSRFTSQIPGVKSTSREKKMSNPVIHDFVAMLWIYKNVVTSKKTLEHFTGELHQLFDTRMKEHKNYFTSNENIVSSYSFVLKAINFIFPMETPQSLS